MSVGYIVIDDDLQASDSLPSMLLHMVKARRTFRWRGKRFNLPDSRLSLTPA